MKWLFEAFLNYAKFSGRARRKEYWGYCIMQFCVFSACIVIDVYRYGDVPLDPSNYPVTASWFLISIVPTFGVGVRRLHDLNLSGWWLLIGAIPGVALILMFGALFRGTKGTNRYGCDPIGIFGRGI
ncbi:DUF805 domain-containing protein [Enterovibrio sp. ZSDZ35]|uniref:DUF805 domain-containing protein n=1 Tax=Enterovibrio qingdaonensis TaxID=2899818 RepID=A0ABT5QTK4_9GAMM|nr:DUF805 domain-containing protein [Enterovibrio sp. ZSDZ35]MDD1784316.1 DUF805 domain-containing protein [Enterovibrio sp. ZSDZ35]